MSIPSLSLEAPVLKDGLMLFDDSNFGVFSTGHQSILHQVPPRNNAVLRTIEGKLDLLQLHLNNFPRHDPLPSASELKLYRARLDLFALEDNLLYLKAQLFLRCSVSIFSTRRGLVFWVPCNAHGLWALNLDALNRTTKLLSGTKFTKRDIRTIVHRLLGARIQVADEHKTAIRATMKEAGSNPATLNTIPLIAITRAQFEVLCRITAMVFPVPILDADWQNLSHELQKNYYSKREQQITDKPKFGEAYTKAQLRKVFNTDVHLMFDHRGSRINSTH